VPKSTIRFSAFFTTRRSDVRIAEPRGMRAARVVLFVAPDRRKRCETIRNNTKGALQKLNATNSFRHAPFEVQRV